MNPPPQWHPVESGERILSIDIIRGLALFGVLIVNILSGFRLPLLEHILTRNADLQGVDRLVEIVVAALLEFKAFTLFSFLFGVGLSIQMDRASSRNVHARSFLARRMGWLLLLGVMHLLLIWNGDILTLYAVCGLLLLPFIGAPWRILFALGTVFIALPEFARFGFPLPSGAAATSDIAQARSVYGHGSYLAILKFRGQETWSVIVPLLIAVLPRTVGLMYWGVAAWRSGILLSPERHRSKLMGCLLVGIALGALLRLPHVDPSIPLALAYLSGLLLWLTPERATRMPGIAALGRMALTNYLLQSLALGFIFYGYGLSLFGRVGSAAAASIGVAIYIAQMHLSRFWLSRFRFGPFEWVWRSLSYGSRQSMRTG